MPIPMTINPKLVSYQRLLKVVREDTTNKSVVNVARIACNLFKQIQILSPNKSFYEQVDEAIESYKNNPNKYLKKDIIIITI
jgi:hypothetical protein